MVLTFSLQNESETLALAKKLAQAYRALPDKSLTIFLNGTLGAGKTTFCRGVLVELGHSGAVKSPTYTLVEPYKVNDCKVYHFDLYRLSDAEELEYMGIRDYFDESALRLLEWPERGKGVISEPDLSLSFEVASPGRTVTISQNSNNANVAQLMGELEP
jgi:tRNA threonylcarbamoyladenosine biosynthesis protein TsaE